MAAIPETISYLLVQVARAHRAKAQELLGRLGLHPGQEMLLFQLWGADGLTHSEIAAQCDITPATVSKMVDKMETAGYIQRRPDAADQRVSRLYLTPAGRDLRAAVDAAWKELEEASIAHLTLEERLLLRRLLAQMAANLG